MDEPPSSPPTDLSNPERALAYYKAQYEQLEHELSEFQASSQELEAELEKDIEAAEKRERALKEKAESLEFEVEEWKSKYKQSKAEASAAQSTLQKEITTLRDANRTLQLKLRDIEVANDDFERQARNTTSSLEDLESKLNIAIERSVMMEEEIKIGEQERENLRIDAQRLRDELSDLKIEAEILQDKLRKRQLSPITTDVTDVTAPNSPSFAATPTSTASSPLINTPPDTKSVSTGDTVSETPTPPSPPMSEASATTGPIAKTPMNSRTKLRLPSASTSITPKASGAKYSGMRAASQPPGVANTPSIRARNATPSVIRNTRTKAPPARGTSSSHAASSASISHIHSLTAQVQRLQLRVQSARSKLPAPVTTPPQASSRSGSAMGQYMPPTVTIRSRKRTTGSSVSASSSVTGELETPSSTKHVQKLSTSGISRLSFGTLANREGGSEIPRPASRTSTSSSIARLSERPSSRNEIIRPGSRTSLNGARTPLSHFSQSLTSDRRPRSSIGGSYSSMHSHNHSQSVSEIEFDESHEHDAIATPSRRGTVSKVEDSLSTIPVPSSYPRRRSGTVAGSRRTSGDGDMKPPMRPRKLSGFGETY
ncbi:nuclear distribution protein nude [Xylogone sp. PMI_703]|nr:nuclear distribution protein nude [Xylogone sp. PMI_703]